MTQKKGEKQKDKQFSRVTFDAPTALKRAFDIKLAQDGKKMKDVLCSLIEAYTKDKVQINGV